MIGLEFRGGDALHEALKALGADASQAVALAALLEAAKPMQRRIAETMPRSPTGGEHAADFVLVKRTREIDAVRLDPTEVAVAVGPAMKFFYTYFLEYGFSRFGKQYGPTGTVRRAFDETGRAVPLAWGLEVWRRIKGSASGPSSTGRAL